MVVHVRSDVQSDQAVEVSQRMKFVWLAPFVKVSDAAGAGEGEDDAVDATDVDALEAGGVSVGLEDVARALAVGFLIESVVICSTNVELFVSITVSSDVTVPSRSSTAACA